MGSRRGIPRKLLSMTLISAAVTRPILVEALRLGVELEDPVVTGPAGI